MSHHNSHRVFICSRYAGNIERNVSVAKAFCCMAVEAGIAPFAPHLLYPQFMDDNNPAQRELGISMGLQFMEACNEVWVYIGNGVSEGMRIEMEHAQRLSKQVRICREVPCCIRM